MAEANSYWVHPVLGPRLKECVTAVMALPSVTAHEIFGSPDDLELCSCLTLFEAATWDGCFGDALARFYAGLRDDVTLSLLKPGA